MVLLDDRMNPPPGPPPRRHVFTSSVTSSGVPLHTRRAVNVPFQADAAPVLLLHLRHDVSGAGIDRVQTVDPAFDPEIDDRVDLAVAMFDAQVAQLLVPLQHAAKMRCDHLEIGVRPHQQARGVGHVVGGGQDLDAVPLPSHRRQFEVVFHDAIQQFRKRLRLQQQGHQGLLVTEQIAHVGEPVAQVQDHGPPIPESLEGLFHGREAMSGRGIRELVTLVSSHVQDRAVQQRRQAIPGQLPADLPFVDQRLVVLKFLAVVRPNVDAVQVQAFNDVERVITARQGPADRCVDEPFKRRDGIGHLAPECPQDSFFALHRWISLAVLRGDAQARYSPNH